MAFPNPMSIKLPAKHTVLASSIQPGESLLHNVYMGPPTRTKVIFYQVKTDIHSLLSPKLLARGYVCEEVSSPESTLPLLQDPLYQVVLVLCVQDSLHVSAQTLLRQIQSHGLSDSVVVMSILPNFSKTEMSESFFSSLLSAGISRIVYEEEGVDKFLQELRLAEINELRIKKLVQFSRALKEAVENSHDAIQVTRDSTVMYVNKSFIDLTGYSMDDCLGKQATDILGLQDNGSKNMVSRKDPYEGHVIARRKSGSNTKQYFKLLPVRHPAGHVSHHVTIQRLLSTEEVASKASSSKHINNGTADSLSPLLRNTPSRSSLTRVTPLSDTPLLRAVHALDAARENPVCPPEIKESLDKCMEILCSAEPYAPPLPTKHSKGLVEGLLNIGRYSRTSSGDSSRGPNTPTHNHSYHSFISPPPQAVQNCLKSLSTWDFNIIHLEATSHFTPLYYVGMTIFEEFHMCETLQVDDTVIASWLKLMESNYKHKNTYHNSTHAADVLQGAAYLIRNLQTTIMKPLDQFEIAALLITAVIHDLDHPGRNNRFLSNSGNELALLYNDRAILENHHVAISFKLTLQNNKHNIYQNLKGTTYESLRSAIIDLVLATDMSKHFEHLAKFEGAMSSDVSVGSTTNLSARESIDNRMLLQRILVKCADISNACRPLELCKEWAARISEEYFSQTDEEKRRGLPIVFPDFDRQTCKIPATQVKFIDVFVTGLFGAWNNYSPIPRIMENLGCNYDHWKSEYDSPNSSEGETEGAN